MPKFAPTTIQLRNGEELLIREAVPDDAEALLAYTEKVSGESDNLTFGPGEFGMTVEAEREFLERVQRRENAIYLVGVLDGQIIASISFAAGARPRIAHTGDFGMSVSRAHWGKGIGTAMLTALLDWCRQLGTIRKVNLRVRADNDRAITLYEKCGFKVEGRISREFCIAGVFYDTLWMGQELE